MSKFVSRAELTDALRKVPADTPVDAVSPGDPSVGIPQARYGIGGYAGGILYLSITAEPLSAGALLSALEENSGGPAEVLAWDMELGDFDEFGQEIKAAYVIPSYNYEDGSFDSSYFEIVLQD